MNNSVTFKYTNNIGTILIEILPIFLLKGIKEQKSQLVEDFYTALYVQRKVTGRRNNLPGEYDLVDNDDE